MGRDAGPLVDARASPALKNGIEAHPSSIEEPQTPAMQRRASDSSAPVSVGQHLEVQRSLTDGAECFQSHLQRMASWSGVVSAQDEDRSADPPAACGTDGGTSKDQGSEGVPQDPEKHARDSSSAALQGPGSGTGAVLGDASSGLDEIGGTASGGDPKDNPSRTEGCPESSVSAVDAGPSMDGAGVDAVGQRNHAAESEKAEQMGESSMLAATDKTAPGDGLGGAGSSKMVAHNRDLAADSGSGWCMVAPVGQH
jgi:hypothetical protein